MHSILMSRQSNIELCRIASIVLVMLVHSTFQSVGWDCSSFGVLLLAAFSIIGVNVFVLITGFFSAEPKIVSLVKLLFICFFWMVIKVMIRYVLGQPVQWGDIFFVTKSNWFIPSYICLLFLAPVLNAFCNSANKRVLLGVTLGLIAFEIWFDLIPPSPDVTLGSQRGMSVLSFVALYLLARFIRLYGVPHWFRRWSFLIYLLCSIFLGVVAFLDFRMGHSHVRLVYAYSNPIVIISAVSFLLSFEKIDMKENRLINHFSQSVLSVLLAHSAIFFLYSKQFLFLFTYHSGVIVVVFWTLSVVLVFVASITVGQMRLLMWIPIERMLRQVVKNNELFSHAV